jgi:hypothetical protein
MHHLQDAQIAGNPLEPDYTANNLKELFGTMRNGVGMLWCMRIQKLYKDEAKVLIVDK